MPNAPISEIVSIAIGVSSAAASRSSFGVPLILDEQNVLNALGGSPRIKAYADLPEMETDGFDDFHKAFKLAKWLFAQSPRPPQVKIGRWDLGGAESADTALDAIELTDPEFYCVLCTSRTATHLSGAAGVAQWVASAPTRKIAILETDEANTKAAAPGSIGDALQIAGHNRTGLYWHEGTAGVWTLFFGGAATTGGTFAATVNGQAVSVAWGVSHDATLTAVAAAIQALDGVATAVATDTNADGLDDTITITASSSLEDFKIAISGNLTGAAAPNNPKPPLLEQTTTSSTPVDAAICGTMLARDPGSATWALKKLVGPAVSSLTTTERNDLLALAVNFYVSFSGFKATKDGTMASGRFTDVQRGVDWIEAEIQNDIANVLTSAAKIPFTDAGLAQVRAALAGALQRGVEAGFLAPTGDETDGDLGTVGYAITVPTAASYSAAQKASRNATGIAFTANGAGALHGVTIKGTVIA